MTRAEELLANGMPEEQADTVAAFLDMEGWPTYAKIVRRLVAQGIETRSAIDPKGRGPKDESPVA